jgi:hypothetical protein
MTANELLAKLRAATENEVNQALEGADIALPISTPYEAIELFNRIIDVVTGERDDADAADRDRISPGFGSTHSS